MGDWTNTTRGSLSSTFLAALHSLHTSLANRRDVKYSMLEAGEWNISRGVPPYVGFAYLHEAVVNRADSSARFTPDPDGWRSSIVDAPIPKALEPTPYGAWRDGLFWVMLLGFNLGLFVLPRR